MSKSIQELKHLETILKQEQQEDREQYNRKVLSVSIKDRIAQGVCWSPAVIKKQYYGTAERLILEIENEGNKETEYAFQSGAVVSLFSSYQQNTTDFQGIHGVINYLRKNAMVVTMNEDELPDWIYDGKLSVQLMFDEGSYREMFHALRKVRNAEKGRLAELREILLGFGKPTFSSSEFQAINTLNPSQNTALKNIVNSCDVAVIHGPPGTGKTTTLVEAIRLTLRNEHQVLVCAQSNTAVDLLTEKLHDKNISVLRLGHPARVTEKTLHLTLDAKIAEHESFREIKKLRKQAEEFRKLARKYKRNYGRSEREQRKLMYQEAHSILNQADMLEHYITNDLMSKSQVITCTLVGSEHYLLKGITFSTLFIDEAGQALEPASWIPITKAHRVIMAGDHFQLPPTIKSFEAAKAGLEVTLFEKVVKRLQVDTMLTEQYRMHETIMGFSSKEFYKNKLEANPANKNWLLKSDLQPLEFIDTAGCGFHEFTEKESKSTGNKEEAHLVLKILENLSNNIGYENLAGYSLGIITPYKAQLQLLRDLILEENHDFSNELNLSINTVDAFQGQERDVIIISLVRSNDKGEIGFLKDTRRMNVAMTRAKRKLIIIGDSATIGGFPFYSSFLDYVNENGGYSSAFNFIEY